MTTPVNPTKTRAPSTEAGGRGIIYVCNLGELARHVEALRPARLVSLVPPFEQPPTPPFIRPAHHLRLELDDINEPLADHILPEAEHVAALIAFVRAWDEILPLLIHCASGISRSMAAAFVAACVKTGANEMSVARHLRRIAPHARPNRRIVALADRLLDRKGRLLAALDAMGAAEIVPRGPLVRLPLAIPGPAGLPD